MQYINCITFLWFSWEMGYFGISLGYKDKAWNCHWRGQENEAIDNKCSNVIPCGSWSINVVGIKEFIKRWKYNNCPLNCPYIFQCGDCNKKWWK